jgi:hypothetical protein
MNVGEDAAVGFHKGSVTDHAHVESHVGRHAAIWRSEAKSERHALPGAQRFVGAQPFHFVTVGQGENVASSGSVLPRCGGSGRVIAGERTGGEGGQSDFSNQGFGESVGVYDIGIELVASGLHGR